MKNFKIEKRYYWLVGATLGLLTYWILYGILTILLNSIKNCWECFLLLYLLTFSCGVFGIIGYGCIAIGGITYFLLGSIIGFLVYKVKKK